MNKREGKDFTIKYINDFLGQHGFSLKKRNDSTVEYIRKNKNGYDGFASGTIDYNPSQIIRYSLFKRIDNVERIAAEINSKVALDPPIDNNTLTISFGYSSLNGLRTDTHLSEMTIEADVEKCVKMITDFLRKTGLPLLDRFNDLREIDKEINGENFWKTDWQMPFNLGGNFEVKRLIIARLSNNNDYGTVVEKTYDSIEELSAENGHPFKYERNDLSMPIPYTIKVLKEIKPIYETNIMDASEKQFNWVDQLGAIKKKLKTNNCTSDLMALEEAQMVLGTPGEVFLSTLDVLIKVQQSKSSCSDCIKSEINQIIKYAKKIGYM